MNNSLPHLEVMLWGSDNGCYFPTFLQRSELAVPLVGIWRNEWKNGENLTDLNEGLMGFHELYSYHSI